MAWASLNEQIKRLFQDDVQQLQTAANVSPCAIASAAQLVRSKDQRIAKSTLVCSTY